MYVVFQYYLQFYSSSICIVKGQKHGLTEPDPFAQGAYQQALVIDKYPVQKQSGYTRQGTVLYYGLLLSSLAMQGVTAHEESL